MRIGLWTTMMLVSVLGWGHPGELDKSFAQIGYTYGAQSDKDGEFGVNDILVDTEGKIAGIVSSSRKVSLYRFEQNGTIDNNFGLAGEARIFFNDNVHAEAVIEDRRSYVVAGYTYDGEYDTAKIALAKVGADGYLDDSFADNGIYENNISGSCEGAFSIAKQGDKYLIGGVHADGNCNDNTLVFVARFTSDGTLDTTFGNQGMTTMSSAKQGDDLLVDPRDNSIYFVGRKEGSFVLMHLFENGGIDTTFGQNGSVTLVPDPGEYLDDPITLAWQGDKIVAAMTISQTSGASYGFLMRISRDGEVDTAFGDEGGVALKKVINGNTVDVHVNDVVVQADRSIVVTGLVANRLAAARVDKNGKIDTHFGQNGVAVPAIASDGSEGFCVALQKDGKILIGGHVDSPTPPPTIQAIQWQPIIVRLIGQDPVMEPIYYLLGF